VLLPVVPVEPLVDEPLPVVPLVLLPVVPCEPLVDEPLPVVPLVLLPVVPCEPLVDEPLPVVPLCVELPLVPVVPCVFCFDFVPVDCAYAAPAEISRNNEMFKITFFILMVFK
jgi:hypothetical protein